MIIGLAVGGSNLFMYCYFGHNATDSYTAIADCLFELKWYNQPLNLQKQFIVIIQNAQQPIYYDGFGVAHLNLNTYCKVNILTIYDLNRLKIDFHFCFFFLDIKNSCQLLYDV